MFWELCGNTPQAMAYTSRNRKIYDEEIIMLKKIAKVLNISEDLLLSWTSENNYGRNQLKNLFTVLTGKEDFWTMLEFRMDYVSMLKKIKISHPNFTINEESLKNVESCRNQINSIFETLMDKKVQERYCLSMGCSKSEFEQIYKKNLEEFKILDTYLLPSNPNTDAR